MDRQTQRGGQRDIGVAVATPGPLSMHRPSTLGFKKQDLPGNNERAGEDITRSPGQHPNEIDEGAHNEGSVNDEAEASTARCTYATSAASNDNKAATSDVEAGAYDEGSNRDEAGASAARRAYAASVAADDNKAAASTARRTCAANSAPMHGRGRRDRQRDPQRGLPRQRGRGERRKAHVRGTCRRRR
jgi:hypothetical protein